MGATDFGTTIAVKGGAGDAFRAAQDRARYESGHRGYTGTIAEKHDFTMIECKPRQNPYNLARKLINDQDPRVDDKWGPAGCIELTGKWRKALVERHGLKGKRDIRAFLFFGWASC
jgi:hypothetical protein